MAKGLTMADFLDQKTKEKFREKTPQEKENARQAANDWEAQYRKQPPRTPDSFKEHMAWKEYTATRRLLLEKYKRDKTYKKRLDKTNTKLARGLINRKKIPTTIQEKEHAMIIMKYLLTR